MEHLRPYLEYFTAHPNWALTIVFLIAFGEALLIIGLFVPSTAVLVGAGILVGSGHLEFLPVFFATAFGCIFGDQVSYWAGRLFGQKLKTLWPLSKYPALVSRGETFVREHGGKSIAVGRFVPGVKAVVPGIVGMLGMNQPFFIFVNVTSGIFWSLAHLLPGVLIGQGLSLAGEFSGRLVVVLLVLLAILGVAGWLIRIFAASLRPYMHHVLQRLSIWARRSNSRALHRFGKAIAPHNPRAVWVVAFCAIIVLSSIFVVDILSGLMLRQAASNLDVSVANLMVELRNTPADSLFIPLTMLADRPVVWAMGIAMAAWLFFWRSWRVAAIVLLTLAFAEFASININDIFNPTVGMPHGGFLSTPTLMSGVVFGFLSALASHAMGRWSKAVVAGASGCVVVAIAFSRLYLGAELLSGVLVAMLIAIILSALFGMIIEALPARRIRPLGLLAFSTLTLLFAGAWQIDHRLARAEAFYAKTTLTREIPQAEWLAGEWRTQTPRRVDLAGKPEEVFAAQWLGNIKALESALTVQGWQPTPVWRWHDAFSYLNNAATLSALPPRPLLHQGLKAKLTMVKLDPANPGQRMVLRVFKSQVVLNSGTSTQHVFLLSVTTETVRQRFHLYAMPATLPPTASDSAAMLATLDQIPNVSVLAQSTTVDEPSRVYAIKP
jgi:membrane protein DedA with SNARE-associated domain